MTVMMAERPIKKRPRGRPRGHSGAAEREAMILDLLRRNGPMTRNALATEIYPDTWEDNLSRVYLALSRLREQRKVIKFAAETGPETLWKLKDTVLPNDWTHG